MSVHYHCPKCKKWFAERAPHPDCDAAGVEMQAQSYVTQDELPTRGDYITAIIAQLVFLAMIVICWSVSPWLALVPVILQAVFGMAFVSLLRLMKEKGIYRD